MNARETERICPAVPDHVGGGWVTACYERVTDADATCPKCGRSVWFMGDSSRHFVCVYDRTQLRNLDLAIRNLRRVLAKRQCFTPGNERSH